MRITMLKNAFKPSGNAKAHAMLLKDSIVNVDNEFAKTLIEKGFAAELPAKADEKPAKAKKVKAEDAPATPEA